MKNLVLVFIIITMSTMSGAQEWHEHNKPLLAEGLLVPVLVLFLVLWLGAVLLLVQWSEAPQALPPGTSLVNSIKAVKANSCLWTTSSEKEQMWMFHSPFLFFGVFGLQTYLALVPGTRETRQKKKAFHELRLKAQGGEPPLEKDSPSVKRA